MKINDILLERLKSPSKVGVQPTRENTQKAREFFQTKWKNHTHLPDQIAGPSFEPGGCLYSAVFGAMVFGGTIAGHGYHAWTVLDHGAVLDLVDDSFEVRQMSSGVAPRRLKAWGRDNYQTFPNRLYDPNGFLNTPEVQERLPRVLRIVDKWAQEFIEPKFDLDA